MKKTALVIILSLISFSIYAQFQRPKNLPNYDTKTVHWGFTFGIDKFDFIMIKTAQFNFADTADNLYGIVHKWQPGGHLGPIVEVRMTKHLKLRSLVTLTFQQRNLVYYFDQGQDVVTIPIASTLIQTPLLIKYDGARSVNMRPYVIAGVAPTYDISATKRVVTDAPKVYLKTMDVNAEMGAGIEWFLQYFKLSTELKFGRGFFNVLERDNTIYTKYIDALYSYYFMFSLHFEG